MHDLNGTRVRVVYAVPGQPRLKEIVAVFLDEVDGTIALSGRPHFGTTEVPRDWVVEMWKTQQRISEPHSYNGETRLI